MTPDPSSNRISLLLSRSIRRVVVKLGSFTLADAEKGLRLSTIRAIASQVTEAWNRRGIRFVVVTSGAIAAGRKKLGMREKPRTVALKQAAAAVGQTTLMQAYERAFERRGRQVGQLLLTHEDFENRERYVNAKNTIETLLARGIVPIVNENDTVATQEIRLGDNDHLAALVTQMVGADLLVLLTDRNGVYDRDPLRHRDARLLSVIEEITEERIRASAGGSGRGVGTGGMGSKLLSARVVTDSGIPVVIASGLSRTSLSGILEGREIGTLVLPGGRERANRRKMWIAYARHPHGSILVDDGAITVLQEKGKSLLPAGIVEVRGPFRAGDAVSIRDLRGREIARGISGWSSEQIDAGKGRKSAELRHLLGCDLPAEVVHRDNLTILPRREPAGEGKGADS